MRFLESLRAILEMHPFALFLMALLICFLIALAIYYLWAIQPRKGTVEWIHMQKKEPFRFQAARYPLDRWDAVAIAIIMILWAVIAFWNLGDMRTPQSFHVFEDEVIEINLGRETELGRIRYFSGLNTGEYNLAISGDRVHWHSVEGMTQDFVGVFKWNEVENQHDIAVQYIRLSADGALHLGELAIYDVAGNRLDPQGFTLWWSNPEVQSDALFDEQHLIPERSTFMNSFYFDEVYHARAAYEHLNGMYPFERSHPPLGKVFISIGIAIFGMVPFGWRFMGTLFGVLMLLPLYCMIKGMFGKRLVAICGTLVFAFDFMHYTQTRIATIDTYAVFFIILMFWFIYRYISLPYETPFHKTLPDLFFAGLFFGLGAASKWTSLYFGLAMALLYLVYQILRGRHWIHAGKTGAFWGYLAKTVGVSIGFFIVLPGIIYYLSYIPYGQALGYSLFSRDYLQYVLYNQQFMWYYHAGLVATHPFSSYWYQWIFNIRPILYYLEFLPDGTRSAFAAFGNPALYWGGLLAMISLPISAIRQRDGRALAIFVGYMTLLAPWLFISRLAFAYHYFTNTIFLALALAYVFNRILERQRGYHRATIIAFTAVTIGLFILFYPALSGMPVTESYLRIFLRWLPSWPI
ncbi:MAG: glycosyltransferase family 39 protein [Oscillospiraceae bacterium]|nr:glycosyltransferase family 39 protein [Oscillospiraceae bacterium]